MGWVVTAASAPAWEETLRDGRVVALRPLRSDDAAEVEALWRRLDAPSRRLFTNLAHLPPDRPGDVAVPRPGHTAGIVAVPADPPGRVVGVARYERTAADTARALVFVDASWRRAGLGTVLLRRLAEAARHAGVRRLAGDVPRSDVAMLGLLEELGLEYEEQVTAASVHASFAVQETDAYLDALLADQRAAARVSVAPFLCPRSIALVGASDKPGSIGALLLANLVASGFAGPVYPVNPRHHVIQGMTAYPDLASCPQPPDLAVVAVPAPLVAGVVDQAGRLGVRAVCVISAGFAEVGGEGRVLQDELRRRARAAGVRLIGPNCMGLLNGGPDPRFNASFSTVFPPPGRLAFVSQSGGLGLAALALFTGPSLGVSGFVSVGNTADLTPNDLLLYWDEDPGTSIILAYLESVPDPRRFARIARRLSRHKPIVVVKSGRTGAGRRAASSHTAAMAARDTAVEALVHQAGVIRAGTLEEMFDVAAVMSSQPVPAGRRVAVLTNVGGPGILVADACEAAGLLVPELSHDTQAALRAGLPAQAAVRNPVDVVAGTSAEQYGRTMRLLGAAEEIDAIIAVFIPLGATLAEDFAREIAAAAAGLPGKPVIAVFMTAGPPPAGLPEAGIPAFTRPEQAAAALGHIARWAEWRARPAGHVVTPPGIDPGRGRAVINADAGQPAGRRVGRRQDGRRTSRRLRHPDGPLPPGPHPGPGRRRPGRVRRAGRSQDRCGHPQKRRRRRRPRHRQPAGRSRGGDRHPRHPDRSRHRRARRGIPHPGADPRRRGNDRRRDPRPRLRPPRPGRPRRHVRRGPRRRRGAHHPLSATPTWMRCSARCAPTGCSPDTASPPRWTWRPSPSSCTGSAPWSRTSPRSPSST